MSNVTPQMVKELRERTGVGMSKCKEALTAAKGDMETAIDILRKAGAASAVKKSSREVKEGLIAFAENSEAFALIEINAETDFVVRNERFQNFASDLADTVLKDRFSSVDKLLKAKYQNTTIEAKRAELVQILGENIQVKRLHYAIKSKDSSYGMYSHMGGRIVVIAALKGANNAAETAREVAMHIAAENPTYLDANEIPEEVKAREAEIARSQIQNKPKDIQDKIIAGKLKAFADQNCLPYQKFVKDPAVTVAEFVKKRHAGLTIAGFIRWQVGESI